MILATQEALKHFKQRRRQHDQHQFAGELTYATAEVVYSGTKGAVDTITRVLAKELGPRKIRVNSINPGMVDNRRLFRTGLTTAISRNI